MPSAKQILSKFKKLENKKNREGMARFGINTENAYGISVYVIRKMAKELKRDHNLAAELWKTKKHEARLLACFIDEPEKVTEAQTEKWAKDFDSWDICDLCCANLFDRTPYAYKKAAQWANRKEEFVKRAAFALIAALSVHDKNAPDSKFIKFFPLIKKHSTDERNYVKKAVNWALRQIGKRNLPLNKKAIRLAKEIKKIDSKSARWIAADALRELESPKVQQRLKKTKPKK
ncbi:MAG: DNA alkylation repair protein [bacterium]|nr:DNA alkylation repair protein [bacterium]